ncbi:ABC transporter permease [Brevibacillus centrosporus]|uniref:ABC transporter permease n=1 Tax=Brevibacillus centrosporus TaxID=54910 RepID=UPI001172C7CC|nr:ABC transporter permease [Brevibacillus centrosporus]MEC2129081.1 ABC transporter permease [Brevibacillus centrosporus]MED4911222.1 ABC transporter permease [Brevibacillus centrosporus]GED29310.1 peptide transporter [Brevibacillus centrosporus]
MNVKRNRMRARVTNTLQVINSITQLKIGLCLLAVIILLALFAPFLAVYDPFALNDDLLAPPGSQYLLGTDGLGRDVFSELLYGARTSIFIGVVAAAISGVLGTLIGGLSGFYRGKLDSVLSEFVNVFLMLPTFFLILLIVALFGSSMLNVMLVIGVTTWTGNAVLMRAQAMSLRERTYVKSLQSIGVSKFKILTKHIIPNGIFPIIANTTMNISGAILTEAGLSFLGLGDPNLVSWGQMVFHGKSYLVNGWWISTFSGFAIVVTVLAFYLIGDGLNHVLSPKLRDIK